MHALHVLHDENQLHKLILLDLLMFVCVLSRNTFALHTDQRSFKSVVSVGNTNDWFLKRLSLYLLVGKFNLKWLRDNNKKPKTIAVSIM